jgi:hypothetical protein
MGLAPGDCTWVCYAHRGRGAPTGHIIVVGASPVWSSAVWILKVFGLALGALAASGTGLLVCRGIDAPAITGACGLPVSSGTGGLPGVRAVVRGVVWVVTHPAIIGRSSASGARRSVRTTVGLRKSRNSRQSRTEHESRNCQNASRGHELFSHCLFVVFSVVPRCSLTTVGGCGSFCWETTCWVLVPFGACKSDPLNRNASRRY